MNYYWELQKYKGKNTRFRCPNCRGTRTYTRYVNAQGEYAPYEFGRCDRQEKCGYFNAPKSKDLKGAISNPAEFITKITEPTEYISWNEYIYGLDTSNDLLEYIVNRTKASIESVLNVFKIYYVRTNEDGLIFPYIDRKNRLTYVKKMVYVNGHRTKYIYTPFKAKKGKFNQCLFGLHLVDDIKTVCVVESEKTALVMSVIAPEYTWVATGGLNMFKTIEVLHNAIIYADKGKAFEYWKDRLDTKKYFMNNLLEKMDIPDGSDLADYYLKEYSEV